MANNYADLSTGTVATAPSPATTGTSLVLQSGEGARMPATPFYATLHPDNTYPTFDNAEMVQVTGVSTDTLTIVRSQKSSTAKSVATGWRVTASVYASELSVLDGGKTLSAPGVNTNRVDIEFFDLSFIYPLTKQSAGGGDVIDGQSETNHPGTVVFNTSTTANSHGRVYDGNAQCMILMPNIEIDMIFKPINLTNTVIRMGFHDGGNFTTEPSDGAYIQVSGTTLEGKTSNGGTRSTTTTSHTLSTNTWYHAKIATNNDTTEITYTLYNESGTSLWSDSLTTNITSNDTGISFLAGSSGTTAQDLVYLDFISYHNVNISRGYETPVGSAGFTNEGEWATSTAYQVDDYVRNDGVGYLCILDHTSSASDEPGVGGSWTTYWEIVFESPILGKSITVESPTATEDITVFRTDVAITIQEMNAVLVGSSTPSVTFNIKHSTDRSAAGNSLITTPSATTNTTTGTTTTSFNDPTIPANSWVWLETSASSGVVDLLSVDLRFTED